LIIQEVDLNTATTEGKTPLHLSVHSGNARVASMLIEMGSNSDKQDKEKRTPLHIACLNNHSEIARCLLEHKADTAISDRGLKVPMHLACINGHTKVVDLLIKAKVRHSLLSYLSASVIARAPFGVSLDTQGLHYHCGSERGREGGREDCLFVCLDAHSLLLITTTPVMGLID